MPPLDPDRPLGEYDLELAAFCPKENYIPLMKKLNSVTIKKRQRKIRDESNSFLGIKSESAPFKLNEKNDKVFKKYFSTHLEN